MLVVLKAVKYKIIFYIGVYTGGIKVKAFDVIISFIKAGC